MTETISHPAEAGVDAEAAQAGSALAVRPDGGSALATVPARRVAFSTQRAVADADPSMSQPSLARSPFTPTHPVQTEAALIGRQAQVARAISALELERAHVAIFGERGHGKTSVANVVAALAEEAGFGVVRHACSSGARFSDLIGAVLDKIPPRFLRRAAADPAETMPGQPPDWTVPEATAALERIRSGHVLIFIDEFDRLAAPNARLDMAELLKNVSDLALRVSFVLIGVAESLGELLALHHSIHRNLVAIAMPLLSDADLSELLAQGCGRLDLDLQPAASALLLQFAHQSPYTAQLLGLHATALALRRASPMVTRADAAAAARVVLEETRPVFAPILDKLPLETPLRGGLVWADLLTRAAQAPCDPFGWFAAGDVRIADCESDLRMLSSEDAGPVLRVRRRGARLEFAFARANLRNHLLLRGAEREGLLF